jgi:hypothetical protein
LTHAAIIIGRPRAWRPFLAATFAAIAAWTPWALVIVTHWSRVMATNEWSTGRIGTADLIAKAAFNLSTTVFDAEYGDARWILYLAIVGILVLVAVRGAFREIADDANRTGLALVVVTVLALLLPDLLFGSHRSTSTRYLVPAYLGLIVLLAAFLGRLPVRRGAASAGVLILGGFVSSVLGTSAPSWWDNHGNATTPAIAAALAASPRTPLTYEGPCESLLALAISGPRGTQVRCGITAAQLDPDAFVLSPSPTFLREAKARGFHVTPLADGSYPSPLVASFRGKRGVNDLDTLWIVRR